MSEFQLVAKSLDIISFHHMIKLLPCFGCVYCFIRHGDALQFEEAYHVCSMVQRSWQFTMRINNIVFDAKC